MGAGAFLDHLPQRQLGIITGCVQAAVPLEIERYVEMRAQLGNVRVLSPGEPPRQLAEVGASPGGPPGLVDAAELVEVFWSVKASGER